MAKQTRTTAMVFSALMLVTAVSTNAFAASVTLPQGTKIIQVPAQKGDVSYLGKDTVTVITLTEATVVDPDNKSQPTLKGSKEVIKVSELDGQDAKTGSYSDMDELKAEGSWYIAAWGRSWYSGWGYYGSIGYRGWGGYYGYGYGWGWGSAYYNAYYYYAYYPTYCGPVYYGC